jgi:hypothetical protein
VQGALLDAILLTGPGRFLSVARSNLLSDGMYSARSCYAFYQELPPRVGYLAPSPNFVRTARIALVAVPVGGMAGASIVLSLVVRQAVEISVAARTLPRSGEVASVPVGTPRAAQVKTQPRSRISP